MKDLQDSPFAALGDQIRQRFGDGVSWPSDRVQKIPRNAITAAQAQRSNKPAAWSRKIWSGNLTGKGTARLQKSQESYGEEGTF